MPIKQSMQFSPELRCFSPVEQLHLYNEALVSFISFEEDFQENEGVTALIAGFVVVSGKWVFR